MAPFCAPALTELERPFLEATERSLRGMRDENQQRMHSVFAKHLNAGEARLRLRAMKVDQAQAMLAFAAAFLSTRDVAAAEVAQQISAGLSSPGQAPAKLAGYLEVLSNGLGGIDQAGTLGTMIAEFISTGI
jgi:hypothetical protein